VIIPFSADLLDIFSDTLVAVPLAGSIEPSTPVTVVVITGIPAYPFLYMNSVGITIESDAEYLAGTLNIGKLGGDADEPDGFWHAMNPSGGFLLPPDDLIRSSDIGSGRERWSFNLTPVGGIDQTGAKGALFNFQFEFSAPGVKTLGFQDFTGIIKRTYYSDSLGSERYWGDISNVQAGIPNSIMVLDY